VSPAPGTTWVASRSVASAPVSLDGATVTAPPETTTGSNLDSAPSIVRIPAEGDSSSSATQVSSQAPLAPAP
jgi:hypothetical protein